MIIRALDSNHDWTFGKGKANYLTEQNAVLLNIDTRLNCFLGDCFFDVQAGIDWFRYLGSKAQGIPQEIELSCRAVILQSYGVVRMNSLSFSFDSRNRTTNLQYNADSIFTSNFSHNLGTI